MIQERQLTGIEAGVVGLGLMGSSIAVALAIAGHPVRAVAPVKNELKAARKTIGQQLQHAAGSGLLRYPPEYYLNRMILSENYEILKDCQLVQECVVEDQAIKASVYQKIHAHSGKQAVISSNTSAIPVSLLQELVPEPGRFIGIHWAEPAYLTRFMEITRGGQTEDAVAFWVMDLAHGWGKEPTFLQKDIRGFVTNRLMYAVYREIFTLVEAGETNIADADKAFRYDAGSWMTFMGLFERMDQLGLDDFLETFSRLFPELGNTTDVPEVMKEIVRTKARGTQEARGLYRYTSEGAAAWERAFAAFNKEIYHLADRYQELKKG